MIGSIQDIAVTDMAPGADIQRMAGFTDMVAALDAGKVDVAGGESLTIVFNKAFAAKVDTVNTGLPAIPIAACFRLDNNAMQEDFNSFLADIRRDGTYQDIMNRWSKADDPSSVAIPRSRGTGRTLTVATFPAMPPFNFISSGEPSGIEPDILTEWANRRNWKLEYLVMDFASQIPAVQTGKADLAMGAISVTEERQKQVLFSDGYFESRIMLITRKGESGILTEPVEPSVKQADGTRRPWTLVIFLVLSGCIGLSGIGIYMRRRILAKQAAAFRAASQPDDAPVIRISHLKKSYDALEVLKDINADVHRGEVISIIGPSGTGKSTLLRCLNLLNHPTGGSIYVDGKNILRASPEARSSASPLPAPWP